jgi:hypothetical protein
LAKNSAFSFAKNTATPMPLSDSYASAKQQSGYRKQQHTSRHDILSYHIEILNSVKGQ